MRSTFIVAACLLLPVAAGAAAAAPSTTNESGFDLGAAIAAKRARLTGNQHFAGNHVGGENIGTAVVIPGVPYSDSGNTCGYANDYDEVCPYINSMSGDVVYSFTPVADIHLDIDLCSSQYDTKVYVYEGGYTPGDPFACNDDAGCGVTGFQSRLTGLSVRAGTTYYIVVDGFFSDCGDYDISLSEGLPCAFCPAGAQLEGEPPCSEDYIDTFNGGCNSTPYVFSPVECNTICGTTFLYKNNELRDTDWYEIAVPAGQTYSVSGFNDGGWTLQLLVTDTDCTNPDILSVAIVPGCQLSPELFFSGPETYYLWAGWSPNSTEVIPCSAGERRYTLFVRGEGIPACGVAGACCLPDGSCQVVGPDQCAVLGGTYIGDNTACDPGLCLPTSVEPATWGRIKNIYK